MAVLIKSIEKFSPAYNAGICPNSKLLSINSNEITDVLDYRFYQLNRLLDLELEDEFGKPYHIFIKKREYEELGLEFETYLMDKQRHCLNKCIFCFIDQLPKGLRKSLYFKDDDSRLSFLFGNYITLTNLTQKEIDRIIKLHISPVNISVHTMDKELRCLMMGNKKAGQSLDALYKFCEHSIKINCQLVVCPGINDGDNLLYTLLKLKELYPSVQNIAVVPVGLTKFRDNLFPLRCFSRQDALRTINIVEEFAKNCYNEFGNHIAYCADEIYLKAQKQLPTSDYYGDFEQLENGVGMMALMESELDFALEQNTYNINTQRKISIATGVSAFDFINKLVDKITSIFTNIECNVYKIDNNFFGENITVSGLITGKDLIDQLKDKDLKDELLIAKTMLKSDEDIFLDSMSLSKLESALNVKIRAVENDGEIFLKNILGCDI
ncbi:MAG: DUF512 domain-containing protein [Clostridia bacterium]|nr:DUF512 domain-containing protein [Clostridia bacterium]